MKNERGKTPATDMSQVPKCNASQEGRRFIWLVYAIRFTPKVQYTLHHFAVLVRLYADSHNIYDLISI